MHITKQSLKDLIYKINGAAIEVHRELGPGLLESIYHTCLIEELIARNIEFETEVKIPIRYKGKLTNQIMRCDLLIEKSLVVELKAVEYVHPVHHAQLLTYMKLLKLPMGLMLNFNCKNMFNEGQKTMVNELYRNLP
jgi:GxxExxY protein